MKPVGEPDAGNLHVRFDERGVETERWPMAPSHRASPRLYPYALGPAFAGTNGNSLLPIRYFFILASIDALIVACRLRA